MLSSLKIIATVVVAVLAAFCGNANFRVYAQKTTTDVSPVNLAKAVQFRYRGVHFGDHRPVAYESVISVKPMRRGGKSFWLIEGEQIYDGDRDPSPRTRLKVEFDPAARRTLFESFDVFPAGRYNYKFSVTDKLFASGSLTRGEITENFETQLDAPVVGGTFGLEPYLAALDLKEGYAENITVFGGVSGSLPMLRQMRLRVIRKQPFQLGGKSIPAYRILVEPTDDNRDLTAVLLVTEAAPHWTLRHEWIVNPETLSEQQPKSTGFDVLTEMKSR